MAYVFHFQPSEMDNMSVIDFNFWAEKAAEIWEILYKK